MDELCLNQRFPSLLFGDNENDADDDGEGVGNDLGSSLFTCSLKSWTPIT